MSQAAVLLVKARLSSEEGREAFAYNDRTGKRVTCKTSDPATTGNLSIGEGINLEYGLRPEEIDFLRDNRLGLMDTSLEKYSWYTAAPPDVQSVCLDMEFNQGEGGLLHFPKMIAAIARDDRVEAALECHVADPKLDASRYAPLRKILNPESVS